MKATNPYEMKRNGSKVRNFVVQQWSREAEKIAYEACFAKFSQNAELKRILLNTQTKELVEASFDKFWGVGLNLHNQNILKKEAWTGENLLGKVLTRVRHNLK